MQQRILEFMSEESEVVACPPTVEKPVVTLMAKMIVDIIQNQERNKHEKQTDQQ